MKGSWTNMSLTVVNVKWVQVCINAPFKVQEGTADGDNLSLPAGERILLSLGWSIWLQVYADSIRRGESWARRLIRSLQEPTLLRWDPQTPVAKQSGSFWAPHDNRKAPVTLKSGMFQKDADRETKKGWGGVEVALWNVFLSSKKTHAGAAILMYAWLFLILAYCLNRGEMLKNRLATLNIWED